MQKGTELRAIREITIRAGAWGQRTAEPRGKGEDIARLDDVDIIGVVEFVKGRTITVKRDGELDTVHPNHYDAKSSSEYKAGGKATKKSAAETLEELMKQLEVAKLNAEKEQEELDAMETEASDIHEDATAEG